MRNNVNTAITEAGHNMFPIFEPTSDIMETMDINGDYYRDYGLSTLVMYENEPIYEYYPIEFTSYAEVYCLSSSELRELENAEQ